MDATEKFFSDIQRAKKHYRAEHPSYDGLSCANEICSLFERENRRCPSLASSFAKYWFDTYIATSASPCEEPTDDHVAKLVALHSLLLNDIDNTAALDMSDWKELCALVNYEAEELDLDLLNSLMAVFVEKQAF